MTISVGTGARYTVDGKIEIVVEYVILCFVSTY